ncbi:Nuclear transport factor 2, eukaryote,NTF2-like domain [Cinara cedri]|uniref:Nuclear transport factor 2, eukaryote,NTF2-like domain n=1 Tax=Cinara cedri TaxID=506608 RepID=A0A5E4MEG4_9HEMI|nr:Nuclear transport factor 2, eukaryote,NTF2-like domain [Cinara cedri]
MENGSEVSDRKYESCNDTREVSEAMKDPKHADRIGSVFSNMYYSVLQSSPEYADDFYEEDGDYQTIYADGSTVVAKTRIQVKDVLMQPTTHPNYVINSVVSMPCEEPSKGLSVNVTGDQFVHDFVMVYRPEKILGYAIVTSMIRYDTAVPVAKRQIPVTTFAEGDLQAITGSTPNIGLETSDDRSLNIAACNEPLPGPVAMNITIKDIISEIFSDIPSVPTEPAFLITANLGIEPAAENIRKSNIFSKLMFVQEPFPITDVFENDTVADIAYVPESGFSNTDVFENYTGVEIASVPEPAFSITDVLTNDTVGEIAFVPKPASLNTETENNVPKPLSDNKKIKKHLCNLVLFSAACWVVYRYIL